MRRVRCAVWVLRALREEHQRAAAAARHARPHAPPSLPLTAVVGAAVELDDDRLAADRLEKVGGRL